MPDWYWYTVNGRSIPSLKPRLTVSQILDAAGYGHTTFRLLERGRELEPTLELSINGRQFDVEVI